MVLTILHSGKSQTVKTVERSVVAGGREVERLAGRAESFMAVRPFCLIL